MKEKKPDADPEPIIDLEQTARLLSLIKGSDIQAAARVNEADSEEKTPSSSMATSSFILFPNRVARQPNEAFLARVETQAKIAAENNKSFQSCPPRI